MDNTFEQLTLFEKKEQKEQNYFEKLVRKIDVEDYAPGWPDEFGKKLNKLTKQYLDKPIKTLSLFSGGGGLDIGFHDVGFDVFQMIEIDERFYKTLYNNSTEEGYFKDASPLCVDIREFDPPSDLEVDFIIGGPPCQTFSAAGRRAAGASGIDDSRGTLFNEYVRILDKVQPKGFLFENVYGILGVQKGETWKEIIKAFESVGYNISYRILDTADYGVPQHRERLIIVGTKKEDFLFPVPSHGPDSDNNKPFYKPGTAIQDIIETKPSELKGKYGHLLNDIPPGLNYSFYTEKLGHPRPIFAWRSKFSDFLYKADSESPVRTIKAQGGQYTGPFHWNSRAFSINELKRLQTFPDIYEFSGGKQATTMQIGNSVPPQFARMLALSVIDQIFNVKLPFDMEYLSKDQELGFRKRKRQLSKMYREKAQKAIEEQQDNKNPNYEVGKFDNTILKEPTNGYLGDDFKFFLEDKLDISQHSWNLTVEMNETEDNLNIISYERQNNKNLLSVEVSPKQLWDLPYKKITISFSSFKSFTASWKAFEHYLDLNNFKADLVQLNGYYQYTPNLKLTLIKNNKFEKSVLWNILELIIEGKGVRSIISMKELSEIWDYPLTVIPEILLELRGLGYEIRSEHTNGQIPTEHILIPYAFPTLNPKSVQLRKKLFPDR